MVALGLTAAAAFVSVVVLTQANAQDPYAAYPVLSNSGPSGITTVSEGQEQAVQGPVWGVGVGGVDIASAREAKVSVPGLRVWAAKRASGGICVLALKAGRKGPASSCAPSSKLLRGATIEFLGSSQETILAGVAPSDVSSVSVQLTNGSTQTESVSDDAYAIDAPAPIESVTFTTGGVQEHLNIGGGR
jgi:hypothetical protein